MTQELNQVIDSVTSMVSKLGSNLVKVVRTSTSEADRRLGGRVEDTAPCKLVVNGAEYATSLCDLTSSGARVQRPADLSAANGNLSFECSHHDIYCEATIIEADGNFIRLHFMETQMVRQAA
jgi:PilZ domain